MSILVKRFCSKLNSMINLRSLSHGINTIASRTIKTSHDLLEDSQHNVEASIDPLDHPDYFGVKNSVELKELFDARLHLGHHEGAWDPLTLPYIHGLRSTQHVIDLNQTVECLACALNVLSHIVYRRGIVLFMSTNPKYDHMIQTSARQSGEYFITRGWQKGMFTSSNKMVGTERLPDVIIAFNLSRFEKIREAVIEASMCNIPIVGIIDTDCDPRLITYPIPGNDDTLQSVSLFLNLFEKTILNAKKQRDIDSGCIEDSIETECTNDDINTASISSR